MNAPAAPPDARWICTCCGYEYDPAGGDPDRGVAPGTPFAALPADWRCPRCQAERGFFEPL